MDEVLNEDEPTGGAQATSREGFLSAIYELGERLAAQGKAMEAVEWFTRAAEKGGTRSVERLDGLVGQCHREGDRDCRDESNPTTYVSHASTCPVRDRSCVHFTLTYRRNCPGSPSVALPEVSPNPAMRRSSFLGGTSLRSPLKFAQDLVDDHVWSHAGVDSHAPLVFSELLQGCELGSKQSWGHEPIGSVEEPRPGQRLRDAKHDEVPVRYIASQEVSVRSLERGTRSNRSAGHLRLKFEEATYCVQPWQAIGVIQCKARSHLFDVGRRVEPIGVDELVAEPLGQGGPDGGLARSRDAHDDNRPNRLGSLHDQDLACRRAEQIPVSGSAGAIAERDPRCRLWERPRWPTTLELMPGSS